MAVRILCEEWWSRPNASLIHVVQDWYACAAPAQKKHYWLCSVRLMYSYNLTLPFFSCLPPLLGWQYLVLKHILHISFVGLQVSCSKRLAAANNLSRSGFTSQAVSKFPWVNLLWYHKDCSDFRTDHETPWEIVSIFSLENVGRSMVSGVSSWGLHNYRKCTLAYCRTCALCQSESANLIWVCPWKTF